MVYNHNKAELTSRDECFNWPTNIWLKQTNLSNFNWITNEGNTPLILILFIDQSMSHLIPNDKQQRNYITGVAWGQILPRQGRWDSQPSRGHCHLKKGKYFFRFKTCSYGLFKSYYNTDLILSLPLGMPENETPNFCCWFLLPRTVASIEATPLYIHLIQVHHGILKKHYPPIN